MNDDESGPMRLEEGMAGFRAREAAVAPFVSEAPSLRDYFAARAMAGLLGNSIPVGSPLVKGAYSVADAMLRVRSE